MSSLLEPVRFQAKFRPATVTVATTDPDHRPTLRLCSSPGLLELIAAASESISDSIPATYGGSFGRRRRQHVRRRWHYDCRPLSPSVIAGFTSDVPSALEYD